MPMTERSLPISRQSRFSLGRYTFRTLLILGDLGSAVLIGWLVRQFLPDVPPGANILQIWLLMLVGVWLITYDIDRHIRLDTYLTYTRVLKIACWTALGYLLFFVVTREFYSLRFLLFATSAWLIFAAVWRWLLTKLTPPLRGLAFENLPSILLKNQKVNWEIVSEPRQVEITKYDFLLIDFTKQYPAQWQQLLTHAHVVRLPILSVPQLIEHLTGKISIEHLNDSWVEATFYIDPFYLRIKRILDLVITILLAPIILLLGLIISLAILVTMGRPILFWQERAGLDDKIFRMVKFRTMVKGAEQMGAASTEVNDNRVTKVGTLLRKLRLDELPQFYNVLRGEMSVIGPRPEHALLADDFAKQIPLFQIRHWLRPGITGWAQVIHGYATNQDEMMEKIRLDLFYLKNLSLWLDLIIIFRTVLTILTGFGSR